MKFLTSCPYHGKYCSYLAYAEKTKYVWCLYQDTIDPIHKIKGLTSAIGNIYFSMSHVMLNAEGRTITTKQARPASNAKIPWRDSRITYRILMTKYLFWRHDLLSKSRGRQDQSHLSLTPIMEENRTIRSAWLMQMWLGVPVRRTTNQPHLEVQLFLDVVKLSTEKTSDQE